MDDLISRQAAIDYLVTNMSWYSDEVITDLINGVPSAQPEVIRCKDCDWWTKQEASLQGRCARYGEYPTGEWFCAGAERREE